MADERRRVYATVIYPESLPLDWLERLKRTKVAVAVSPLHDRDVWSESDEQEDPNHKAGQPKKPHHHVVLYFEGKKTPNQVLSLLEPLGVSYVEPVESPRAYNRYLAHLDQPEKAAYNPDEIIRLNGAQCDISKPNPTADEQRKIRASIVALIRETNITEYCDLVDYADANGLDDWAWYISNHTVYLNGYLKSKRHSANQPNDN